MNKAESRIEAFEQFKSLLLANPDGLTLTEIAKRMGVHRGTPRKYIDKFGGILKVIEITPNRFTIDRDLYEVQVTLNQHESMALHIATRLLATSTDKHNKHAGSALRKLSEAIDGLAPQISNHMRQSADVMDAQYRYRDPIFMEVLEKLTKAWALGQKVKLTHKMTDNSVFEYTFSPYFIEPYAIGRTLHVIGFREPPNQLRTFKIERICTVEILTGPENSYEIPADFDPTEQLKDAWGIWYTQNEPEEIVLHFSAGEIAQRVQETTWHYGQEINLIKGGKLEWKASVAEWREMLPWVRGWGSDVEVIEPEDLRQVLELNIRRSAKTYGIQTGQPRFLRPWGKTVKGSDEYHPAVYHMLDVAHMAQQLLSAKANPRWRRVLGRALGVDPNSLVEWLPWIISLHDIGKLTVPFQALNDQQRDRLEQDGFDFGKYSKGEHHLHHTLTGRLTLKTWADETFGKNRQWKQVFLDMVAGHHGKYQNAETYHKDIWSVLAEADEWQTIRSQAIEFLKAYLVICAPAKWPKPDNVSAAIVALNGFTILCDWLGSDETYFKPKSHLLPHEYIGHSKTQAHQRVQDAGFFTPTVSQAPSTFTKLFNGWTPRPLQTAIDQIPDSILHEPTLTIIESLTGEGKTEAALTLAHRIGRISGTDEMYLALPTTATSNAMFTRFQEHLRDRLGIDTSVSLIHGQAFLVADDLRISPADDALEHGEPPPALDWFAPKKRSLLSPFGVGTVDQAELSALNVKHNALRLIGLAGKVVILDEVHAYDTYMTTIIQAMLEWLAALGTSVILLSATLPLARRRQLVEAYTGQPVDPATQSDAYPYLLTVSGSGRHECNPPADQKNREIALATLNFAEDDASAKAQWLLEQVKDGGTACWITNIVRRSQDIFEAVKELAPTDVDIELLHSQFPLNSRQQIEANILEKHGKAENGKRPTKAIVIGTQVLEQSLDLDFDLMVSDLAPIDLLLQRVGRVHRHPARTNRSPLHPTPKFWVNAPVDEDKQLIFGADKFYTEYILAKSWEAIQNKIQQDGIFNLPTDYRPLVEHVYTDIEPEADSLFRADWEARNQLESKYQQEANLRLSGKPTPRRAFWKNGSLEFKEEDDSVSWINAQTRYIEQETITVIPLQRLENGQVSTLDGDIHLQPDQFCHRENQLKLLQHSLKISNRNAVKAIQQQPVPPLFSKSGLLKSCYPLFMTKENSSGLWKSSGANQEILFSTTLGMIYSRPA